MKQRTIIVGLITCFVLCAASAFALPTLTSESPEVRELSALFTDAGLVFPTETYPLGRGELAGYARRLAAEAGSPAVRQAAREWLEAFDFNPDRALIASDMEVSVWGGGRTGDVPWSTELDFQRDYIDAPPFFDWTLNAERDGSGGIAISAELRTQYEIGTASSTSLFIPKEGNPIPMENYFITSGYFYKRFDDVTILVGRTPVHFGDGSFSSGMPSQRLPFMDSVRLGWEFGPLKMTAYASSLENRMGEMEKAKLMDAGWNTGPEYINTDTNTFYDGTGTGVEDVVDLAFGTTNVFLAVRRFEYAFKKTRLAVTSMQIVSRENNYIHLGDFFPVYSWHNAELGPHNNSLHLEATTVPFPGLKLAVQGGWDDINAADAFGVGDTGLPTIYFYLAGAAWSGKVLGLPGGLSLEAGTSHYLWGVFHEYAEDDGNYLSRAIYRYKRDEDYVLLPLTSPYGPGVNWLAADFSLQMLPSISVNTEIELKWRNPAADLVGTEYIADPAVEDTESYGDHRFALRLDWSGSVFSLFSEAAMLFRDGNYGWEGSVGGSFRMLQTSVR